MKDGYWVIRTYVAGQVGEKIKFWVPGTKPKGRMTRRNKSDIRKAAQNEDSSERQMARLINANFGPGDLLLGLDYAPEALLRLELEAAGGSGLRADAILGGSGIGGRQSAVPTGGKRRRAGGAQCAPLQETGKGGAQCEPLQDAGKGGAHCAPLQETGGLNSQESRSLARATGGRRKGRTAERRPSLTEAQRMDALRDAADRTLANCIRRAKRELAKDGIELKYISVTADVDGKTGEAVRVHHHLIVKREARDAFLHKWQDLGLGGVSWSPLEKQDDYLEIAKYLLAQARRSREGAHKYTPSRNLVRPQPKDRVAASSSEVRVPKGCRLLHRQEFKPGKAQYIRYRIETDSGGAA